METENKTDHAESCIKEMSLAELVDNVAGVLYWGVFVEEAELRFINRRIKPLIGYSADEILTDRNKWFSLVHADDKPGVSGAFDRCRREGKGFEIEYRLLTKDGNVAEVLDRVEPAFNQRSEVTGFYGLCVDISSQKKARRELERTQMLQNLGKLTAGIAHEINTPIQFIGDNMRFLGDSFQDILKLIGEYGRLRDAVKDEGILGGQLEKLRDAETKADLDFVEGEIPQATAQSIDGIQRVSKMITAMRDFSHVDERRFAPGDINKALRSTIIILRNEVKYVADVKINLDERMPMIMCCLDDIQQVFLNLIINAAHSIKEVIDKGGQRGVISVNSKLEFNEVVITVSDTGTGISEDIKDKIFEPFFTTKGHCQGTGQGLSIVRTIVVENHGGRIECDSKEGVGTTFKVYLPLDRQMF